jgi:hypothetical protein
LVQSKDPVRRAMQLRHLRGLSTSSGLIFTDATHLSPWTLQGKPSSKMQPRLQGTRLLNFAAALFIAASVVVVPATVADVTGLDVRVSAELSSGNITWDATHPRDAVTLPARPATTIGPEAAPAKFGYIAPSTDVGEPSAEITQSHAINMLLTLLQQGALTRREAERGIERLEQRRTP